jgi:hypothetical protein
MKLKLLPIVACTLLLQGCWYQTVDHLDLQRATYFCGSVEAVAEVQSWWLNEVYVTCINGNRIRASEVKIVEDAQHTL